MNADADLSPIGNARLIADFLEALDLDRVTLVGNDTGGALCQLVVTRHPERIGRLVLTNCDAYDNFPPRMFAFLFYGAKMPGFVLDARAADAHRGDAQAADRVRLAVEARHPRRHHARAGSGPTLNDAGVRRDTTKLLKGVRKSELLEAARTSRSSTSRC